MMMMMMTSLNSNLSAFKKATQRRRSFKIFKNTVSGNVILIMETLPLTVFLKILKDLLLCVAFLNAERLELRLVIIIIIIKKLDKDESSNVHSVNGPIDTVPGQDCQ
jgi:hypothetical protein